VSASRGYRAIASLPARQSGLSGVVPGGDKVWGVTNWLNLIIEIDGSKEEEAA
jgi:hypothetical protein